MYTYYQLIKLKRQNSKTRLFFLYMHTSGDVLYHFNCTWKTQRLFSWLLNIKEHGMGKWHTLCVSQCSKEQLLLPFFLKYILNDCI